MIELTHYDGFRIGEKFSLVASEVESVSSMSGETSLIRTKSGREIRVLESRKVIEKLVEGKILDLQKGVSQ